MANDLSAMIGVWTTTILPGRKELTIPGGFELDIKSAVLVDPLSHTNGRTVLKLIYSAAIGPIVDSTARSECAVLCILTPGSEEQRCLQLTLPENWNITFEVVGGNTINLTGIWKKLAANLHTAPALDRGESVSGYSESQQSIYSRKRNRASSTPRPVEAVIVADANPSPVIEPSVMALPAVPAAVSHIPAAEPGEIKKEKLGTGTHTVRDGDTVSVLYILTVGENVVRECKREMYKFKLGESDFFPGIDDSIKGMKVGGEHAIVFPASVAQGYSSTLGKAPVTFQCKLMDIE